MKMKSLESQFSKRELICIFLIFVFCAFALFIGVYVVIFSTDGTLKNVTTSVNDNVQTDEKEELKENFQTIFKNELISNVNTVGINRKDEKYDLVYVAYNKIEKVIGEYEINVKLPHINIDSIEIENINNEIDNTFKGKAESILNHGSLTEDTIYNIKYQAYLNNDILSLIIECTLKENSNAQRIIIKTYNCNIKTGEIIDIQELAKMKQLNKDTIEKEIRRELESQISMEKSLAEAGYKVFNRYPENDMYKFENLRNYFIDEKNHLYIIFAYGNTNNTSEMDFVIF